jgi:hypothetical protein
MKSLVLFCLFFTAFNLSAEETLVPLDMELGYWETTIEIEESEMIRNLLASMPESQRAMVKEMMTSKIQSSVGRQCITAETLKDAEKQIRESLSGEGIDERCELVVVKSSSKEFVGTVACTGLSSQVHTKVINSKRNETTVVADVGGMGENKINSVAQWKSSDCPAGLN